MKSYFLCIRKMDLYKVKIFLTVSLISGVILYTTVFGRFSSDRTTIAVYTDNKILQAENNRHNLQHNTKHDISSSKNRTIWKKLPEGTQMGELQVAAILKVIPPDGNLLVWGLGNDSPFWHDSSKGKVIFIEHAGFWFETITVKYPYLEAYTVKYTTENVKSFNKYINSPEIWSDLDIRSQLPSVVTQTTWHVIIVDAPPGHIGRFQSIYTSSLLAQNGTHIFVDDFERKVENQFSLKMLGRPTEIIKRPPKHPVDANEQAHFIHVTK